MPGLTRREALAAGAGAVVGDGGWARGGKPPEPVTPRPVAAVVTVYWRSSHADVLLGKILEGWKHDGPGPALRLASLYGDQFPDNDLARRLCKKYDVPCSTRSRRRRQSAGRRSRSTGC